MNWRRDKAKQMIIYHEKRINFLKKAGEVYNRYDIAELKNKIEEYYKDFPILKVVIK